MTGALSSGAGDTDNSIFTYRSVDKTISLNVPTGKCIGSVTWSFRFKLEDKDGLVDEHQESIVWSGPTRVSLGGGANTIAGNNVSQGVADVARVTVSWTGPRSSDVTYSLDDTENSPDNSKFSIVASSGVINFEGDSTAGKESWSVKVKV